MGEDSELCGLDILDFYIPITHKLMKEKLNYVSPESELIVVSLEGCIALSAPGFDDGGDLFA
jgi:hypothetical protein